MPFTLTWMGDATDADCVSFALTQNEGDLAHLSIEIRNPRVGLLADGRELWATLSHDVYGDMFYGRLIGVPSDMAAEVVTLEFLARPEDFDEQKAALAETLKVAPFWDPVFIAPEDRQKPDTVLEARPALWHIDRVTGEVTISDIMSGEDGTIDFGTTHFGANITYGDKPAWLAECRAEVKWTQSAQGEVDVSKYILDAFKKLGSTRGGHPATYTGEGLVTSWPKPGASIGGGWEVANARVERIDGILVPYLNLNVNCATGGFKSNQDSNLWQFPNIVVDPASLDPDKGWIPITETFTFILPWPTSGAYNQDPTDTGGPCVVGFQQWVLTGDFSLRFAADRVRSEQIHFTLSADVQPIVSDMSDAFVSLDLRTGEVDQPIDAAGAIPIGDTRRNSYMLTDRGKQSLAYLVTLCRAKLLSRARAVRVAFDAKFEDAVAATLRHSALIEDPRLPGGQATGKIVGYSFSLNGDDGAERASLTIGCMIGRNGTLSAPAAGSGVYVDGVFVAGVQASVGSATSVAGGDVQYTDYDTTAITLGGLDLFNLTAEQALDVVTVADGVPQQEEILQSKTWQDTNEAIEALNSRHTQIAVSMVPVTGDELKTPFEITVSELMVPKTIDLEAPSAP